MADEQTSQRSNQLAQQVNWPSNKPSTLEKPKPLSKPRPGPCISTYSSLTADNDSRGVAKPSALKPTTLPRTTEAAAKPRFDEQLRETTVRPVEQSGPTAEPSVQPQPPSRINGAWNITPNAREGSGRGKTMTSSVGVTQQNVGALRPANRPLKQFNGSAKQSPPGGHETTHSSSTLPAVRGEAAGAAQTSPPVVPPWANQLIKNRAINNNINNNGVLGNTVVLTKTHESTISDINKKTQFNKPTAVTEDDSSKPAPLIDQQFSTTPKKPDVKEIKSPASIENNKLSTSMPAETTPLTSPTTAVGNPPSDVIVVSGGKSYRRINLPPKVTSKTPRKPCKPPLVDLTAYRQKTANRHDNDGDFYDDVVPTTSGDVTLRKVQTRNETISRISEFTEEEEIGPRPKYEDFEDEIYQDIAIAEDDGLIYEELN